MNEMLKALLFRGGYMSEADAGEGGGSSGGAVDRGDSFAATPDADPEPVVEAAVEADSPFADETKPDADEAAKDDKFIPKSRFDEAVRKERDQKDELARRVKEFEEREQQRAVTQDFSEAQKTVKEMIKQHSALLADGELDKASDLMENILAIKEEINDRRAAATAASTKDQVKEEMRYDALVAKLEADYPQINPDDPDFDDASVRKVQAYMAGLMQTAKMSPSQALREAVETLIGSKKAVVADGKAEEVGMRRKADAVKKALDAKGRQPASTRDVGLDHDKQGGALDSSAVMKMSYEEFSKLTDAKLSELRGDFVS